ncbi:MAG TPA: hypothetical protein VGG10_02940 [Rhizomicrobium sp.]|jgi:DNA adenine methylase
MVIERLPFADLIRRCGGAETLFCLEPPYMGTEHFYRRDLFTPANFEQLRASIDAIKGRFI